MKKIAFIGTGNMASAVIHGLLSSGSAKPADIILFDRMTSQYERFAGIDVGIASSIADAVQRAEVVFLSVKPQNFEEALTDVKNAGADLSKKLFVSIGAGISTAAIRRMVGSDVAVVRCMPNTPLQIGLGVTAVCRTGNVSDEDFDFAAGIFGCAGMVLRLDESQMNTIIAVNGSSPAYFYYFIDAMVKSAKAQGLDCDGIVEAVCKTVIGSAEMLMRSGKTPEELIRAVTSPGGTTERAMNVFRDARTDRTIDLAMRACTDRAVEMSAAFGGSSDDEEHPLTPEEEADLFKKKRGRPRKLTPEQQKRLEELNPPVPDIQ
ncbi:MAG: pyrroline-5-carboxylate reductase [Clostridia bacterium]|nr:pyrroline-5-carboxylate reductase [Clostridia bacterium]